MSDELGHPRDDLQLLLEERLPAPRRGDLERHLAGCLECRRELEALRRIRAALREKLPRREVPAAVSDRIAAALRAEAGAPVGIEAAPSMLPRRAFLVGGAALAAAALAALIIVGRRRGDPLTAAATDLERFAAGRLELELRTDDPAALESFFAARDLGFPTRVFDFGMMGFRLAGGSVHRLAGARSALFAYEAADGGHLVCEMYVGATESLPPPDDTRVVNRLRLQVYSRGSVTLVFWQEGAVVCVLASDGEPGAAVDLAAAKAGMV